MSIAPLRDCAGRVTHFVVVGRDITARHLNDPMTGLETRALLLERIKTALARLRRNPQHRGFAILFLDVDRFKAINDTYGHKTGDQVILELSNRIRMAVREADVVAQVSHLNRDEFVVLVEDLRSHTGAHRVAERILDAVGRPISVSGREVTLSMSVGIALGKPSYAAAEEVLRDAETAMERAKRTAGSSCHIFDPDLHQQAVDRLRVSFELRRAISQGEITVYYQPIVSVRSGEVTGAEALARWRHPSSPALGPGDFILAAEEQGLIGILGERVLQDACRQMHAWHRGGFPGRSISVNVSAQQFRDPKFVDTVASVVAQSELDPHFLKLELTESTAADDSEALAVKLLELKTLGVDIMLDDFGTGYSSLSYLTRFPIDKLKIDRSFVQRAPTSGHDATIVSTIVAMAHSLGYGVVAEGVETEEQLALLHSLGCEEMQGYLFCRPVPATDFDRLLREGLWLEETQRLSRISRPEG